MQSQQITTKDLDGIKETLIKENLAYKKCKMYEGMTTEPALKTLFCETAQHHQCQFDALNQYLNSHQ